MFPKNIISFSETLFCLSKQWAFTVCQSMGLGVSALQRVTVNWEFFVSVLFLQNFAYTKFREIKILTNTEYEYCRLLIYVNHALFTY